MKNFFNKGQLKEKTSNKLEKSICIPLINKGLVYLPHEEL